MSDQNPTRFFPVRPDLDQLKHQAKDLLLKELAVAKGLTEQVLQARVDEMFRN